MRQRNYGRVGWRARIGVITPAIGMAVTADFHKIAPEGVALVLTPVSEPLTEDTVEQLEKVGDYVADAAKKFLPAKVDVIVWNTSTGSLMKGYGYDKELIQRIEKATGVPATTASTGMLEAFAAFGVKKVCIAMPYVDAVNEREKKFIEDNGYKVLRYKGLQILPIGDILDVPAFTLYKLAKEVDLPEADAIFISCAGMSATDILEDLEQDLGKPVMSTNQVSLWSALRKAKIREPISGYGRLLREF